MICPWKIGRNINLRTALYIKANGRAMLGMVLVYKYGQMEPVMKAIGRITKPTALESFGMWMVTCLMENGEMTRPMVMVYIHM